MICMAWILAFQSNAACSNVTILKTCQTLFTHFVFNVVLSSSWLRGGEGPRQADYKAPEFWHRAHIFFFYADIYAEMCRVLWQITWYTHTHTKTLTHKCAERHSCKKKKKKNTQKSPDDCLSAEKITVSQKSFSNSYSIVVFSLSGSGASLGIDCQAYCLYHLALYHRTRTHQRWERHVH